MTLLFVAGGIAASGLFGYLAFALMFPEKLS